jgi:hypothetical protein
MRRVWIVPLGTWALAVLFSASCSSGAGGTTVTSPISTVPNGTEQLQTEIISTPPAGFVLGQGPDFHNGPWTSGALDKYWKDPTAAARYHFVAGYDQSFEATSADGSILSIDLLRFADPRDARSFASDFWPGQSGSPRVDPTISSAIEYDTTLPDGVAGIHGVTAVRTDIVMMVEDYNDLPSRPPLVDQIAAMQASALP